jgi:Ca2+:H+ antiporter
VPLSVSISIILLIVYGFYLVFALVTHSSFFTGSHVPEQDHAASWPVRRAAAVLASSTAVVAWMSEILVGSIQQATNSLGLSNLFVGVFVVAILGNAAEHAAAVTMAIRNRMDLTLSIAIGSSVQVALFVAPVLVLLSLAVGPKPMDLAFPAGLVLVVFLSVLITGQVAGDGRSEWLKGVQLLAVYVVLGLTFFFMPMMPPH